MMQRRSFLKVVPAMAGGSLLLAGNPKSETQEHGYDAKRSGAQTRELWVEMLEGIASPVLRAGSVRELRKRMPVEKSPDAWDERECTYLEAVGRLLAGIAPWLECDEVGSQSERTLQETFRQQAVETVRSIVDPDSPDYLFAHMEKQMLVDAAFLAHAMLRAPRHLWQALDARDQAHLVRCLRATREVNPYYSNWLLFSAMVEAFFLRFGLPFDEMRMSLPLNKHKEWYLGDGMYGDGPEFHWDYYNSYVIQPMLMDLASTMQANAMISDATVEAIARRFSRYAVIQERLIAPDGTFPAIGRSIVYRMGAFQHLAQAALQERLPETLAPAQVREAMTAVMLRLMQAPGTYDAGGWLTIGLVGHQPALGEAYISTGSCYLCATALLPLGLPPQHAFWSGDAQPWTSVRLWNGENLMRDAALKG